MMLAQSVSVEAVTNRISYFHAVEGIIVSLLPATGEGQPQNAATVIAPNLSVTWLKEYEDSPDVEFESEILCKTPSGQLLFATEPQNFHFEENINFHRFVVQGILFSGEPETGIHVVEARLRRAGREEWSARQTYPFHVQVSLPPTATTTDK